MTTEQITISLPETLYIRLQQAAQATKQSLPDIVLRAVQIGSPPSWDDAPAPYQAQIAALDRLDDNTLWQIARSQTTAAEMERYEDLLDKKAANKLSLSEQQELDEMRFAANLAMLRKAHAVALLRWRGHMLPPADKI